MKELGKGWFGGKEIGFFLPGEEGKAREKKAGLEGNLGSQGGKEGKAIRKFIGLLGLRIELIGIKGLNFFKFRNEPN